MGSLLSTFSPVELFTDNDFREIFFIRYLALRGPTQYNWNMIPGDGLKPSDDEAMARHKFKIALKKQSMLSQMLHGIDRKVTRCLSPCLINDFSLEGSLERSENMYTYTYKDDGEQKSKSKSQIRSTSRPRLGNLDHIVSAIYPPMESAQEIASYASARGSEKERRARSRPERTSKTAAAAVIQRQALSVHDVRNDNLPPVQEAPSEIVVEKIELGGKRSRKACWPPKEMIRSVLKDPKNRPTNFLLGRFRHLQEEVEVEYRFNKFTEEESFEYKGNLELILPDEGRCKYQVDKFNNNLDEKAIFFESLPYFFNNYEARIFWNGFLMGMEGSVNQRMCLKSVSVDPPTLIFDMSGLKHISASRNHSTVNITGDNDEGDGASKSFSIRGRSEKDVKMVEIQHATGTAFVSVGLPPLSATMSARASHESLLLNSDLPLHQLQPQLA